MNIFKAFLKGMGCIGQGMYDIMNSFTPEPRSLYRGFEEDGEALRGDWQAIGDDMRTVMNKIEEEYNPMAECANRMEEVRKRFNKVLRRYEERNE